MYYTSNEYSLGAGLEKCDQPRGKGAPEYGDSTFLSHY